MVLESVRLEIKAGEESAFERDFARAADYLRAAKGYLSHDLLRGCEDPRSYLLLVRWSTLESHTVGFRGSEAYQDFRLLLYPHYAGPTHLAHYTPVPGI